MIARGGSRPTVAVSLAAWLSIAGAALGIAAVYTDFGWLTASQWAIASAFAAGILLRRTQVPIAVIPVAQSATFLASQWWVMSGPIEERASSAGLWGRLLAYRDLLLEGVQDSQDGVAPTASSAGLVAMTALLVFMAALIAETLAVGLGHAGAAGLVALALLAVPAGIVPDRVAIPAALIAALGWLALLLADQASRERALTGERAGLSAAAPAALLAASALLLSGAAVALVPPGPDADWMRRVSLALARGGEGEGVDPLVQVEQRLTNQSRVPMVRYRSPDGAPAYLSLVRLTIFDGNTWWPEESIAMRALDRPSPNPAGLTRDSSQATEIEVLLLNNPQLPVPEATVTVAGVADNWRWDARTSDVVSIDGERATGQGYTTSSASQGPSAQQLNESQTRSALAGDTRGLPPETVPAVQKALDEALAGSVTTPYEAAVRIQEWLARTGGFRYSLTLPESGDRTPLQAFFEDRVGFCQQFASAMAAMSREAGIPSRVVVGFASGTAQPDGWIEARGTNAHAWPELWFDDVGWMRFEPTPGGTATVSTPAYAEVEVDTNADPETQTNPTPPAEQGQDQQDPDQQQQSQELGTAESRARWVAPALVTAAAVLLLAVATLAPQVVRQSRRRRRRRRARLGDIDAAWQEVVDTAVDGGSNRHPYETPSRFSDRLMTERSIAAPEGQGLRTLTVSAEARAYGPDHAAEGMHSPHSTESDAIPGSDEFTSALDQSIEVLRETGDRSLWQKLIPRSVLSRGQRD